MWRVDMARHVIQRLFHPRLFSQRRHITLRAISARLYLWGANPGHPSPANPGHLSLGRGAIEKKHSTDNESTNRIRASVSASTLKSSRAPISVRALTRNGPPARKSSSVAFSDGAATVIGAGADDEDDEESEFAEPRLPAGRGGPRRVSTPLPMRLSVGAYTPPLFSST